MGENMGLACGKGERPCLTLETCDNLCGGLISNVDAIIAIVNREHKYILVNNFFAERRGKNPGDICGKPVAEILGKEAYQQILPHLEKAFSGKRDSYTMTHTYPEIGERHLSVNYFPVSNSGGDIEHVAAIIYDVTELKNAELTGRQYFKTLTTLIDAYTESCFLITPEGIVKMANRATAKRLGVSLSELIGSNINDLLPDEIAANQKKYLDRVIASGRPDSFQDQRGDYYYQVKLCPITDESGTVTQVAVFGIDISDHKKREFELLGRAGKNRQVAEELEAILDNLPLLVFYKDCDNRFIRVNDTIAQAHGLEKNGLEGKSLYDIYPSDMAKHYHDDDLEVINSGKAKLHFEEKWKTNDGERWVLTSKIPMFDDTGKARGIIGVAIDITDRKRGEQAIEEVKALFNLSPDLLCTTDFNGYFKQVNPAFSQILGWSEKELLNSPINDFIHPDDLAVTNENVATVISGKQTSSLENRFRCKDGGYRWLSWNSVASVEHSRIFAVGSDITGKKQRGASASAAADRFRVMSEELERKNLELQEADQLKDKFLSIVSHELRTPITIVKGVADNMLDGLTGEINEKQTKYLQMVANHATRLNNLIDNLLDMAKLESGRMAITKNRQDLGRIAAAVVREFATSSEEAGVQLSCSAPDGLLPVPVDTDLFSQALSNLLSNALKFTPRGGQVSIAFTNAGDGVHCAVSDTGSGITPEELPHIFDRFKQVGRKEGKGPKGTGLGLAITKEIIEQHHGTITAESTPGQGTVFTIHLPSEERQRILIVDDDKVLCRLLEESLGNKYLLDFAFDGFSTGMKLNSFRPDLVLLDIMLPDINGDSVCRDIRANVHFKQLPVIAITASEAPEKEILSAGFTRVLRKPLLVPALRELLKGFLT